MTTVREVMTSEPITIASGKDSAAAIERATPTCTRLRLVTRTKYRTDSGIQTPLPRASIPIAVTKSRCWPIAGKPRRDNTNTSSGSQRVLTTKCDVSG